MRRTPCSNREDQQLLRLISADSAPLNPNHQSPCHSMWVLVPIQSPAAHRADIPVKQAQDGYRGGERWVEGTLQKGKCSKYQAERAVGAFPLEEKEDSVIKTRTPTRKKKKLEMTKNTETKR